MVACINIQTAMKALVANIMEYDRRTKTVPTSIQEIKQILQSRKNIHSVGKSNGYDAHG